MYIPKWKWTFIIISLGLHFIELFTLNIYIFINNLSIIIFLILNQFFENLFFQFDFLISLREKIYPPTDLPFRSLNTRVGRKQINRI